MPPLVLASTTSHKREPLLPTLEVLAKLDLRDIDLNLHHILEVGVPVESAVEAARAFGLRIRAVSGGWCDFFDPAPKIEETFRSVLRQVEIARRLDVSLLRLFFGRLALEDYTRGRLTIVADNLRRLSDLHPGTTFVLENHDGASRRPDVCAEILERTSRANVRMNFDPINFERDGVSHFAAFETLKPFIGHLHLKGLENGRFAEFGVGDIDLTPLLRALATRRYDGAMSVEYEGPHDGTLRLYQSVRRARSVVDTVFGATPSAEPE